MYRPKNERIGIKLPSKVLYKTLSYTMDDDYDGETWVENENHPNGGYWISQYTPSILKEHWQDNGFIRDYITISQKLSIESTTYETKLLKFISRGFRDLLDLQVFEKPHDVTLLNTFSDRYAVNLALGRSMYQIGELCSNSVEVAKSLFLRL